jgi:ABC-type glycerol-3-phosphate transport system permease component
MATEQTTVVIGDQQARVGALELARRRRVRLEPARVVAWILLVLGAIVTLLPIVWLVSTSLKIPAQTYKYPPEWIPNPVRWQNYPDALTAMPFGRFTVNTLIISGASIAGVLLSSSLAAYGFARLRFPGRDALFVLVLTALMLPQTVTLIPRYIEFRELGWIDSWWPLIVPNWFGNAYFIFLLRQFFRTIPRDLSDAARVDGASEFRIFWQIIMPLSRPALMVVVVFSFLYNWNDFLEPLIYITSEEKKTIALGLYSFQGGFSTEWNLLMAASAVMIVPVVVLFFFLQRYFIQGVVLTGLKG